MICEEAVGEVETVQRSWYMRTNSVNPGGTGSLRARCAEDRMSFPQSLPAHRSESNAVPIHRQPHSHIQKPSLSRDLTQLLTEGQKRSAWRQTWHYIHTYSFLPPRKETQTQVTPSVLSVPHVHLFPEQ